MCTFNFDDLTFVTTPAYVVMPSCARGAHEVMMTNVWPIYDLRVIRLCVSLGTSTLIGKTMPIQLEMRQDSRYAKWGVEI